MSIGSQITKRRKEIGMTQEELAFRMGVSAQAVSSWERGIYLPETEKLKDIAKVLSTSATLLHDVKHAYPEYYNAVFLLKYQMLSVTETLKRLL